MSFDTITHDLAGATVVTDDPGPVFAEFGKVPVAVSTPDSDGGLAASLAGSITGIPIDSDLPVSDVPRHIFTASIASRTPDRLARSGGFTGDILDPIMLALMHVAEFYTLVEGFLWQLAQVPLQLGFHQDYRLTGDEGAIREARDYLESLNLASHIEGLVLSRFVYGQWEAALARETPGDRNSPVTAIHALNPKHVAIRPQVGFGTRRAAYVPPAETIKALSEMSSLPRFFLRPVSGDWNEPVLNGSPVGFEIYGSDFAHIHVPKLPNHIYGVPPLTRAMGPIDALRDLNALNRATIKGVRSQLWLFSLENPKKGEAAALRSALSTDARTGLLVWGGNLKVEQHGPKSIDALLGGEAKWDYTMDVLRALGITPRLLAGEAPTLRAASGDAESDVALYLDRLLYDRYPVTHFIQALLNSRFGKQAPIVELPDIGMAIAKRIRDQLVPLLNFGLPSPTTAFNMAGLDPVVEMQQHKADQSFRDSHLHPYTGFSQAGPSGVTDSPSGGRPQGRTDSQPRAERTQASVQSDYRAEHERLWATLQGNLDVAEDDVTRADHIKAFVLAVQGAATVFRRLAYLEGYAKVGGYGTPDEERIALAIAFDALNLADLEATLLGRAQGSNMTASLAYRASLYATMGYNYAYAAGVWQAQRERGATHWVRVLNPLASQSGPCPLCQADAGRLHPIEEPWSEHPNGVCGQTFERIVQFYTINDAGRFPGNVVRVARVTGPQ